MTQNLLAFRYAVRGRFQRAARIDLDLNDGDPLAGYVLHATGSEVLRRVFVQTHETPQRAFTWTGPYGGGKSSLALYFSSLVDGDEGRRAKALELLDEAHRAEFGSFVQVNRGWLVIPVIGRREAPAPLVAEALEQAISVRWPTRKPKLLGKPPDPRDETAVIQRLVDAGGAVAKKGDRLLLIVDELGKILEHQANCSGDLHFFQMMAEAFSRGEGNCLFIGILHQSFQEYASRLTHAARDEWAKVQGRFTDIPISSDVDEVVDLLGHAIEGPRPTAQVKELCERVANSFEAGRLGNSEKLADRLATCRPLHPLAALLLGPMSRRRFAQNERSTFGFLCSGEPGGFRDFLMAEVEDSNALYSPDRLWDYLQFNLEPAILSSPDGHRWSEAADAVDRTSRKGDIHHIGLIKVIALLDLFGRPFGLKATTRLLEAAYPYPPSGEFKNKLEELRAWSVCVYRRHEDAWAVFAGSDIDLDAAIHEVRTQLGDGTDAAVAYLPAQQPIVAKRHYHDTGALRWFELQIIPASHVEDAVGDPKMANGASGQLVLALPNKNEDPETLRQRCIQSSKVSDPRNYPVAVSIPERHEAIREVALELAAVERLHATLPDLAADSVSRRELEARIGSASESLEGEIQRAFGNAEWLFRGETKISRGLGDLSRLVSRVATTVFEGAPTLKNELINRDKPSSAAVAARRALMHRMVSGGSHESLGIEGHPPELGIYRSIILSAGLHRSDPDLFGSWRFSNPRKSGIGASYRGLWNRAEDELIARGGERVPLSKIYGAWRRPPVGLARGVMPLLALAFLLAKEDELAVYVDGLFTPILDDYVVDRLLQDASEIEVRHFPVIGVRRKALKQLSNVVAEGNVDEAELTPLTVAKPLVAFAHKLHPWVKRTRRLSAHASKVRDALLQAEDPYELLFNDLPVSCGIPPAKKRLDAGEVEQLERALREATGELRQAYPKLLDDLADGVLDALGAETDDATVTTDLSTRCRRIAGRTGDFRLDAFARRVATAPNNGNWAEGVASLAGNKPPRDWTDSDLDRARIEVQDLAARFRRVEMIVLSKSREPGTLALSGVLSDGMHHKELDLAIALNEEAEEEASEVLQVLRQSLDSREVSAEAKLGAVTRLLSEMSPPPRSSLSELPTPESANQRELKESA